jgi:hypothetical protein
LLGTRRTSTELCTELPLAIPRCAWQLASMTVWKSMRQIGDWHGLHWMPAVSRMHLARMPTMSALSAGRGISAKAEFDTQSGSPDRMAVGAHR